MKNNRKMKATLINPPKIRETPQIIKKQDRLERKKHGVNFKCLKVKR